MNSSIQPPIEARSPQRPSRVLRRSTLACAAGFLFVLFAAPTRADDAKVTYDDHLAPILRQRCSSCHSQNTKKADLDVTSYSALMQGGSSGAVIEPGDADASHLFGLVAHTTEPFMPQNADKLPDSEIDIIRRWINGGALENAGSKAAKPKKKMTVAVAAAPGKRPDVVPMPTRMVLEPTFVLKLPPMARSLAASPWAPLVAVTSQRQVLLYNTNTLELVGVFAFPEGQPNVVRFSRDGRLLLVGGGHPAASGKVVVWDITTGERVFEVGKELDIVLAADISADHKHIALGGPQRLVRVYSTETGELQYQIAKHTDWVLAVEFSPDGVLLATADRNGGLCVWEANTGHEYLTLAGHTAAVNAVAWRGDSNVLASASEDATLRLWEMENGTQIKNWNGQTPLLSLGYTRDARLVTCGRDQLCRIWNQDGKELIKTPAIGEVAVSVAYSDESNSVITSNWSGVVQVYKSENAANLGTLVTNPPTLDERLVRAKQALEVKTKAATPLLDAVRTTQAANAAAQAALTAAQQKLAPLKSEADRVAADVKQISTARATADAERNKAAANLQQIEGARPSIAEALRHLTEALGKLPNDAKLIASQSALNEQLKSLETGSSDLQAKITELTTAIATADSKLKDANAQLEAANKTLATAAEQNKPLEAESQKQSAALEAANKAAKSAETELAEANRVVAKWQDEIKFRDQIAALQKDLDAAHKVENERQAILDQASAQLAAVQATVSSAKSKRDEAANGVEAVTEKIRQARRSNSK
jgi:Planctomycete cytochrome C/WD domain, G-beta repeat